jgi:hypothetical protein
MSWHYFAFTLTGLALGYFIGWLLEQWWNKPEPHPLADGPTEIEKLRQEMLASERRILSGLDKLIQSDAGLAGQIQEHTNWSRETHRTAVERAEKAALEHENAIAELPEIAEKLYRRAEYIAKVLDHVYDHLGVGQKPKAKKRR